MPKIKTELFLYPLCLFVLFASNGFVVWKYKQLQSDVSLSAPGLSPSTLGSVLESEIPTTMTGPITLAEQEEKEYQVLFFFSAGDCPSCIEELAGLANIEHRRVDIGVYGMISHSNVDEAIQLMGIYGFDFPLLQDPDGAYWSKLDFPKTPWKVVVHRKTGKILLEDPPSNTEAEREAFLTRLMTL